MKFASIKPNEIAVVKNDMLVPVGHVLARHGALPQNFTMLDLIANYDRLKIALDSAVANSAALDLDANRLKPPVENPTKIWAAAGNYKRGTAGLGDARGRGSSTKTSPEELLENIFLKPPSALAGPGDNILI